MATPGSPSALWKVKALGAVHPNQRGRCRVLDVNSFALMELSAFSFIQAHNVSVRAYQRVHEDFNLGN